MIFRRARWRVLLTDAVLVALPVLLVARGQSWGFAWLLALSGLFVWGLNVLTLHFPHEVEVGPERLSVRAYGRERSYAFDGADILVRRFLVRDRVLLRVKDRAGKALGAHWLVSDLGDVDDMLAAIETRRAGTSTSTGTGTGTGTSVQRS